MMCLRCSTQWLAVPWAQLVMTKRGWLYYCVKKEENYE